MRSYFPSSCCLPCKMGLMTLYSVQEAEKWTSKVAEMLSWKLSRKAEYILSAVCLALTCSLWTLYVFCLLNIAGSYPEGSQAGGQLPLPLSRRVALGCWLWRWINSCLQPPKWRSEYHFQWTQGCSHSPAVWPSGWPAGVWLEGEGCTSGGQPFHRDAPWRRLTCAKLFGILSGLCGLCL